MTGPRIAIIDDHELVRSGLSNLVRKELHAEVLLESDDPDAILLCEPLPDVVLLDLDLGERQASPKLVSELQARGCRVLIVSAMAATEQLMPMMDAGVSGFVSKRESADLLIEAIRTILADGVWTSPEIAALLVNAKARPRLSATQERVLVLYASGMTMETVARHLGISVGTANTHLKRARAKYAEIGRAMPNRVEVYRTAKRDGLITD